MNCEDKILQLKSNWGEFELRVRNFARCVGRKQTASRKCQAIQRTGPGHTCALRKSVGHAATSFCRSELDSHTLDVIPDGVHGPRDVWTSLDHWLCAVMDSTRTVGQSALHSNNLGGPVPSKARSKRPMRSCNFVAKHKKNTCSDRSAIKNRTGVVVFPGSRGSQLSCVRVLLCGWRFFHSLRECCCVVVCFVL